MLHTKPQRHWLFDSGEEDFWRFLPYMGVAAILFMWPRPRQQTFVPPSHWGSIWNLAMIGQAILKKIFESGGRRTDHDGRTDEGPWLQYKLTNETKISQNFIKSPLKNCLLSQISAHRLWHVCLLRILSVSWMNVILRDYASVWSNDWLYNK